MNLSWVNHPFYQRFEHPVDSKIRDLLKSMEMAAKLIHPTNEPMTTDHFFDQALEAWARFQNEAISWASR